VTGPAFAVLALVVVSTGWVLAQAPPPRTPVLDYPLREIPIERTRVTGGFWQTRLETNRTVTIPHILEQNEKTGRVDNFRKAAGQMPGEYVGRRFNDTDIYKIIEAASYSLVAHSDPALAAKIDELIGLIEASQEPDGYLFPARTINPASPAPGVGAARWQHENTGSHELYNAGHLYEAAVAHAAATGSRRLLDIAIRNADLVQKTFGPTLRRDAPGHEEIELALVRLYRATADRRYLDLSKYFLDERGSNHSASLDYTEASWRLYNDRAYRQDDIPLIRQTRGQGHAVRATYVYAAMTDIAAMLGASDYGRAVDTIWQDIVSKRIYLTGGLGSVSGTEAFGDDYALPSRRAYAETCASVGGVLWYHRMFLQSGEARYLDALEQTLYNGLLSGVSVAGDAFFYQNPLEADARGRERVPYMDVACCPANLSRLVAQVPRLLYAQRGRDIFVNLYAASTADVTLDDGATVRIRQTTEYPWEGGVRFAITADKPASFTLQLRVPGWLGSGVFEPAPGLYNFVTPVTGIVDYTGRPASGAAAAITPGWVAVPITVADANLTGGTPVEAFIDLPMPVRRITAHPALTETTRKAAIQRGPVLYALEGADHNGQALDLSVPLDRALTPERRADVLGGVTVLTAPIPAVGQNPARTLTAIPYYAWANRGRGEMVVWIRQ
jgi:DUF1680 family protein